MAFEEGIKILGGLVQEFFRKVLQWVELLGRFPRHVVKGLGFRV